MFFSLRDKSLSIAWAGGGGFSGSATKAVFSHFKTKLKLKAQKGDH